MSLVQGLRPYLPAGRPRGPARWWSSRGSLEESGALTVRALEERAEPPAVSGAAGLAAPCSLPVEFLEHLGIAGDRERVLRELERRTVSRLLADARAFAARRPRGSRHPLRDPNESVSALHRSRLPLFAAALPLLRAVPALPWAERKPPFVFEVDPPAWLRAAGLPWRSLSGPLPDAVHARARVLDGLAEGACGVAVRVEPRDVAIASREALEAVVAAAAAAWLLRRPPPPPRDAAAWIPVP